MNRIKLAVIADDFIGGAYAASFLKRKHANVVLLTGIPSTNDMILINDIT